MLSGQVTARLEDIWYATFLNRYWRQWVINHSHFTLKNNFITSNAYQCIEINAHSLLALVFSIREDSDRKNDNFMPWLLGSQSCEKTFRSLCSMTSTFSTVVNFSLLGLLHRMHKLHIQEECTGDARDIRFPRQERCGNKKDGENKYVTHSLEYTNQELHNTLKRAERRAQENVKILGMEKGFIDDQENWTSPPIPTHLHVSDVTVTKDESDEEDDSALSV